uniref:Uncharacterized protein n=1 Tax=Sexangularia sp. CB-2014 TaxID=1486929 RepID=A0A7S1V2C5_9EUKA|mmetsp:Transcript_10371/g.32821  ORF Transcript_10371/g.32821 Transcript_10371/m.32821 type:complete len:481 (+) Transcript_10371:155-1597(+)
MTTTSFHPLIDDLASPFSLLLPYVRSSDLLMVRLSCRAAWTSIQHPHGHAASSQTQPRQCGCVDSTVRARQARRVCGCAVGALVHESLHRGNIVERAVSDGHVPLLRWALEAGANVDVHAARAIGALGNEQLARTLISDRPSFWTPVVEGLASGGHGVVLHKLLTDTQAGDHPPPSNMARWEIARHGLAQCASYVRPEASWWRENMLSFVLSSGDLAFVQWVVGDATLDPDSGLAFHAAYSGSVAVLEYVVEQHGAALTPGAARAAALHGHVEVLRWLLARECPLDDGVIVEAARGGHVPALECLVDEFGVALVDEAADGAAHRGHLEALQWLVSHGCPVNQERVACCACIGNDESLIRWWIDAGHDWNAQRCSVAANSRCNVRVLRFLHERGVALHPDMLFNAVVCKDLDSFYYGLAHGGTVDARVATFVVKQDQLAFMEVILKQRLFRVSDDSTILRTVRSAGSAAMKKLFARRGIDV